MIRPGLVSITFRKLTAGEIVGLAVQAALAGIEWGGDVHVPHGDLRHARVIRRMTADAGLEVAAYGSYYRVGHGEPCPFEAVVDTAVELGAPTIRVWAGKQGSDTADAAYRDRVVQESREIADLASDAHVTVSYEFHGNTLTDTNASARRLLDEVAHPSIRSYWQPPRGASVARCLEGLDAVMPWLTHTHVFAWRAPENEGPVERLPLAGGAEDWDLYLHKIASLGGDRYAEIEFVRDDQPEVFLRDAATLAEWLAVVNANGER